MAMRTAPLPTRKPAAPSSAALGSADRQCRWTSTARPQVPQRATAAGDEPPALLCLAGSRERYRAPDNIRAPLLEPCAIEHFRAKLVQHGGCAGDAAERVF